MAGKKTTTESGKEATGKEIRRPNDTTLKNFNAAFNQAHEEIDEANKDLKEAASTAAGKHLHLPSFKVVKGLYDKFGDGEAKNAEKLALWLANFDKAREYFKLDELANLQGRMFGEGEIGSGPKAGDGAPEPDEDEDLRPRHLRQPGASAASVVQDLAAKTGAKTQPEEPLDKVGRGAPKLN